MRTVKDFRFRYYFKQAKELTEEYNYLDALYLSDGDEDVVIMQWTGLYDHGGKKIFEGDIMKINNNMGTFEHLAEMFWDKPVGCFGYYEYSSKRPPAYCDGVPIGEVIGNIYENPELLKERP